MTYFADAAALRAVVGGFLTHLPAYDALVREATGHQALVLRLQLTDPQLTAVINLANQPMTVELDAPELGSIGLQAPADLFHEILLGRASVGSGMSRRQVLVRGSVASLMKAMNLFFIAPYLYPHYLRRLGWDDLIPASSPSVLAPGPPPEGSMNALLVRLAYAAGFAVGLLRDRLPGTVDILAAVEALGRGLTRATREPRR